MENSIFDGVWIPLEKVRYGNLTAEFFTSDENDKTPHAAIISQGDSTLASCVLDGGDADVHVFDGGAEKLVGMVHGGQNAPIGKLLSFIVAEAERVLKEEFSDASGVAVPAARRFYFINTHIGFSDFAVLQNAQKITCDKYRQRGFFNELAVISDVFPDGSVGNVVLTMDGRGDNSYPFLTSEMRAADGKVYAARFGGFSKPIVFDDNHVMRLRVSAGDISPCFKASLAFRVMAAV